MPTPTLTPGHPMQPRPCHRRPHAAPLPPCPLSPSAAHSPWRSTRTRSGCSSRQTGCPQCLHARTHAAAARRTACMSASSSMRACICRHALAARANAAPLPTQAGLLGRPYCHGPPRPSCPQGVQHAASVGLPPARPGSGAASRVRQGVRYATCYAMARGLTVLLTHSGTGRLHAVTHAQGRGGGGGEQQAALCCLPCPGWQLAVRIGVCGMWMAHRCRHVQWMHHVACHASSSGRRGEHRPCL